MAIIPAIGQISLRQILTNMGYGAVTNVGLDNVSGVAMGVYPAAIGAANNQRFSNALCMPYQRNVYNSLGANGVIAPNANWSAATTNFRDGRLSEFRLAYSGKPTIYTYGRTPLGPTSRYQLTPYAQGSESGSGVYYFYMSGPGSSAPAFNAWTTSGTNNRTFDISGGYYRAVYTTYVQDYYGCGNKFEFFATLQY